MTVPFVRAPYKYAHINLLSTLYAHIFGGCAYTLTTVTRRPCRSAWQWSRTRRTTPGSSTSASRTWRASRGRGAVGPNRGAAGFCLAAGRKYFVAGFPNVGNSHVLRPPDLATSMPTNPALPLYRYGRPRTGIGSGPRIHGERSALAPLSQVAAPKSVSAKVGPPSADPAAGAAVQRTLLG